MSDLWAWFLRGMTPKPEPPPFVREIRFLADFAAAISSGLYTAAAYIEDEFEEKPDADQTGDDA